MVLQCGCHNDPRIQPRIFCIFTNAPLRWHLFKYFFQVHAKFGHRHFPFLQCIDCIEANRKIAVCRIAICWHNNKAFWPPSRQDSVQCMGKVLLTEGWYQRPGKSVSTTWRLARANIDDQVGEIFISLLAVLSLLSLAVLDMFKGNCSSQM